MFKLNHLNTAQAKDIFINKNLALEVLNTNDEYEKLKKDFLKRFSLRDINTFSFSKEGFLGLLLDLKLEIAVSLGESEALIEACLLYEGLGFKVTYLSLKKDGTFDYESVENLSCKYLFISSYIIDTFVKIDLKKVRESFKELIISNASARHEKDISDVIYFDCYKLSGYFTHSQILHNDIFKKQNLASVDTVSLKLIYESICEKQESISCKANLIKALKEELKEDFFFFVDEKITLENSLHFALRGIKAREIIRTLSLSDIFISNGEGCSLGYSKPSRVVQVMGYTEKESRQAISISFIKDLNKEDVNLIAKKIAKAYRQIKALNE